MGFLDPDANISAEEQSGILILNLFILGIGGTLDLLGVLFWLRKVRPNKYFGVRIASMGDNQDVWYEVNEYAGKVFTVEGLFLVVFSLLFMILPYSFSLVARLLVFLAVFIVTMAGVVFLCVNRAKAFARPVEHASLTFNQL